MEICWKKIRMWSNMMQISNTFPKRRKDVEKYEKNTWIPM